MVFTRMILEIANQLIIIFSYNMHSVVTCRRKDDTTVYWHKNQVIPLQALKHVCLFLNDFIMRKNYQIFHQSITSWNKETKLNFKIKGNYFKSFFASNSTPPVNSSTAPNLPQQVSTTRLLSFCFNEEVILNLLMLLTLTKHMKTIIKHSDDQAML